MWGLSCIQNLFGVSVCKVSNVGFLPDNPDVKFYMKKNAELEISSFGNEGLR